MNDARLWAWPAGFALIVLAGVVVKLLDRLGLPRRHRPHEQAQHKGEAARG